MVMYDNEFETRIIKLKPFDKIESQHRPYWCSLPLRVSESISLFVRDPHGGLLLLCLPCDKQDVATTCFQWQRRSIGKILVYYIFQCLSGNISEIKDQRQ